MSNSVEPNLYKQLPAFISVPIASFIDEKHPHVRLWKACDLIETTLKFISIVGLSWLSKRKLFSTKIKKDLEKSIYLPSLNQWCNIAERIASEIPGETEIHSILHQAADAISAVLGDQSTGSLEHSFLAVRNILAHGGVSSIHVCQQLLERWEPDILRLLPALQRLSSLRVYAPVDKNLVLLRGDSTVSLPEASEENRAVVDTVQNQVEDGCGTIAMFNNEPFSLWPLGIYAVPSTRDPNAFPALKPVPQLYSRAQEEDLQMIPIGSSEAPVSYYSTGVEFFKSLFCTTAETNANEDYQISSFIDLIETNRRGFVGRLGALDRLTNAFADPQRRVAWVHGPAGVGKSALMAEFTSRIKDKPAKESRTIILPYVFDANDARCSLEQFRRYTIERIIQHLPNIAHSTDEGGRQSRHLRQEFKTTCPISGTPSAHASIVTRFSSDVGAYPQLLHDQNRLTGYKDRLQQCVNGDMFPGVAAWSIRRAIRAAKRS
ncbi:MAG: ATP-binding protein [Proteobacteria bacterium]|nr:ATP-binding protein [Pseudomonadota bacterium]